jgi:tetratricopeptide (TPR) repeat protein
LTLGEALDRSASAILIWSSKYEDSEWCKAELNTLQAKELAADGFRYVIAKVDMEPLPGFAAGKLYIDFSDQREGPSGRGLLSIICGLAGQPLPAEAVALAAQTDEQTRDGLLNVKAAREAGDIEMLLELAKTQNPGWTASPALTCAVAEALIALNDCPHALILLDQIIPTFSKALRPRQLYGLALARQGEWLKAQLVLGKLHAAGEIDPETLGIYARTWMDRYKKTNERLFLLKSRDLYRQAFEASPKDYYTGVNAASKSLLLQERETAKQLAARVEALVGAKVVPSDYWKTATVAEVQLLQGNYAAAGSLYEAAIAIAPLERGSHESTRGQEILLLDCLDAPREQRSLVEQVFARAAAASV